MGSVSNRQFAGGCTKALEKMPEDEARAAEEPQLGHGAGICTWFNVHMGFGFLSMTARAVVALDPPVDVFVHQSKLYMEGFRSLKEGEAWSSPIRSPPRAWNLSASPALIGCSVLGVKGGPKGRICRNTDQRETGATTVEV